MGKTLDRVRVAMVGAGKMASRVHYPSLASFPDVEIAAVCDLDPSRLHSTADKYHIPQRYTDYRRMVEEVAPDAVYVIGHPMTMYDIWAWCLQQGLNLYIEKPMGITVHQARALAYLAEKKGCITQVSFQRRCNPLFVKLRDEVRKRGPIVHAVCTFIKSAPEPYLDGMSQMIANGVHALDTLRAMCGGEVAEVQSVTRRVLVPDINFMSATIRFDNDTVGIMLCSFVVGRRLFGVEMHAPGISAVADLEGKGHLYLADREEAEEFGVADVAGSDAFHIVGGFLAKNRDFINGVKSGCQPESNFADAVKTMELAEVILAQTLLKGR
ncbi:MAG: Gfo/Idh/MocA family oxidoreductase [Chloroflexi bacterium]|nr:Gfo/Idh/MocA family oxidoreductase [Chloroflexota bacterium]